MAASLLLIDDHVVIAQAMAGYLQSAGYDPVEYLPPDALDVESMLVVARELRPHVALVDLNLGTGRSGITLIGPLAGLGTKVIAFTASEDRLDMARCVEAGAVAFLQKATAFDVLVSTIGRVVAGEQLISPSQREELLSVLRASRAAGDQRLARLATLTPREQHVLKGLLAGETASEIAQSGYVSVKTVRTQIESIRRKLGVKSQLAAVAYAREVGWQPGGGGTG